MTTAITTAFSQFYGSIGLRYLDRAQTLMILIGLALILIAALRRRPVMFLVALGFGILAGNMPFSPVEEAWAASAEGYGLFAVLHFLLGPNLLPALVFLGIGAATDFGPLIASPGLAILGAGAQAGIFITILLGQMLLNMHEASVAAVAGGAHPLLAIFAAAALEPERLASGELGPQRLAAAALAALAAASLAPQLIALISRVLTTPAERAIRMSAPPPVSRRRRLLFPILAFIICVALVPAARVVLAMLFLGNLLREAAAWRFNPRAVRACTGLLAALLAFGVGLVTNRDNLIAWATLRIFLVGLVAFTLAAGWGILMAKMMNVFTKHKINPLVGAAAVTPAPRGARIVQRLAAEEDPGNQLLIQALAPNLAGTIALTLTIGIVIGMIG